MKDDEYIFLPLTILGIPFRYNALLSGHIQLGEYSIAVREQASRAGFSTKHVVIDSREPEIKKPATGWQCEGVAMSALRLKIPWLGFGSPGWIRTSDQLLRRQMLFPLSYRQIGGTGRIRTFDHSVNSRTHNRCASDPETTKPRRFRQGLFVHHAAT